MFNKYIPRGIIYHQLSFDFLNIFKVLFSRLNDEKEVEKFENAFAEYNGSQFCVAFPFARMGIYHSLETLNIPKGSEIIMPPITIKAILDVIMMYGLKPRFVDLDMDTFSYDLEELKNNINKDTKSILISYLYGLVPNIPEIVNVAKEKNLYILEDFSQCLNGEYENVKTGNFSDIGIYSSSTTKTFDTYGGGLVVTNNEKNYKKLKEIQMTQNSPKRVTLFKKILLDFIRNFLTNMFVFNIFTIWIFKILRLFNPYSLTKYVGEKSKDRLLKFPSEYFEKFSSFQAKVGMQTIDLVEEYDFVRIKNVNEISKNLNYKSSSKNKNVYWQYLFILKEKKLDNPLRFFKKYKVDTSQSSLPLLPELEKYNFQQETPKAEIIRNSGYFLPSYHRLNKKDIERITKLAEGLSSE